MPNPKKYLRGFKIYKGLQLGDYVLEDIQIHHVVDQRFRRYEYPMVLTFELNSGEESFSSSLQTPEKGSETQQEMEQDLLEDLKNYTKEDRVIYTSYHNPYKCDFGTPQITQVSSDGNTVVIESTGHGVRIYTNKKKGRNISPSTSSYLDPYEEGNGHGYGYGYNELYNLLMNSHLGFTPGYVQGLDSLGLLYWAKRFNLLTDEEFEDYKEAIKNS